MLLQCRTGTAYRQTARTSRVKASVAGKHPACPKMAVTGHLTGLGQAGDSWGDLHVSMASESWGRGPGSQVASEASFSFHGEGRE